MLLVKDYMKELEEEAYWLRYFYSQVGRCIGPRYYDIRRLIKNEYTNAGNTLPKEYMDEDGN